MPLEPGQKLGNYELRGPLGAGGMGEVYRALDAGIGREVALKILPPLLAGDPERLARFDREARLLGSLNHANIATLYGFERGEKVQFLVMELVEGESLAQRLKKGPIALDDTLECFQQIAEGLESAHDAGIIHRDLKPGNIMITPAGKVKLLDFGLAKALEGEGGVASDASMSPTITGLATARGEVMGTAYYMSPEQARGKPVDRRTDIWAFGCVLYECITGRMAFQGETISDTIALILQREPDLAALPSDLPPRITELLHRCFEKDARRRLRDIGEARLEIEKVRAGNLAPTHSSGGLPMASGGVEIGDGAGSARRSPAMVALLLAAGLAIGAAFTWLGLQGSRARSDAGATSVAGGPVRFVVDPPGGFELSFPYTTPDGSRLVYHGREVAGSAKTRQGFVFIRRMDSLESERLDETEGVRTYEFSPDGRWIAYVVPTSPGAATAVLRKLPLDRSVPPLTLCDWGLDWTPGFLWPETDLILALTREEKLVRIAADGGGVSPPEDLRIPGGVRDLNLRASLPTGSRALAQSASWTGRGFHQETHVLDYGSGEVRRLLDDATSAWWAPTGHIVFTRNDTLFGVAVRPDTLEPTGAPVPLLDGLGTEQASAGADFGLSPSGTLVYRPGGRWGVNRRIVFVDGEGKVSPWSDDHLFFQDIDVSPDGSRVAVTVMGDDLLFAVWVSEMERPRLRLLAKEPELDCDGPHWLPDNETVLYSCTGSSVEGSGTYRARADGTGRREMLLPGDREAQAGQPPESVTPDGRWLIVRRGSEASPSSRLLLLDLRADDPAATARPLAEGLPPSWAARFSPDGRLVAYLAQTTQRLELHVRRFNDDGSVGPPVVAADGEITELYFHPSTSLGGFDLTYGDNQSRHWKLRIGTEPSLSVGDSRMEFDSSLIEPRLADHVLLPDGRLMAVQRGADEDTRFGVIVVVNWLDELKRRMAAAR